MGKFVVWMLARTPNSHPTPAHLPDVGGDIPAVPTLELKINGEHKIFHAYRGQDLHGLKKGGDGNKGHHQLAESAITCLKRGPQVGSQRVKAVVNKREGESFCVHKFINLSIVINDNLC